MEDELILETLRLKKKENSQPEGTTVTPEAAIDSAEAGPLRRKAWELRVSEAGPWAACSAEPQGVLPAGQISFVPGDSTARCSCSCRPASRPPVCWRGTGQWETAAQRGEPRSRHLKPRPSALKTLTWPFWSSPFKNSPFLRLSLFPTFLELSRREASPCHLAGLAARPGPSVPAQPGTGSLPSSPQQFKFLPQLTALQELHGVLGLGERALSPLRVTPHQNQLSPFYTDRVFFHHSYQQQSSSAHKLRLSKKALTLLLRYKANAAHPLTHLKYR